MYIRWHGAEIIIIRQHGDNISLEIYLSGSIMHNGHTVHFWQQCYNTPERWNCQQVLYSQTLDPPCYISPTQQLISSSCTFINEQQKVMCYLYNFAPPAFTISEMNSLPVASLKYLVNIFHLPLHHQYSCGAPPETSICLLWMYESVLSIWSAHKNSGLQSSAEGLQGKTNMQSAHKTITDLSCKACLKLDARALWKRDKLSSLAYTG